MSVGAYVSGPRALLNMDVVPSGTVSVVVLDETRAIEQVLDLNDIYKIEDGSTIVVVDRDTDIDRYGFKKEMFNDYVLLDILVQRGDRWWSALCENDSCCPPEGQPLGFTQEMLSRALGILTTE